MVSFNFVLFQYLYVNYFLLFPLLYFIFYPNIISRKTQFKQSPDVLEGTENSHQMRSLFIGMNESLDLFANCETIRADTKEADMYY